MNNRPYDIIVFGATGFTGKLVVEYLIEHYGVNNELFTWAIAGRNEDKIKKIIETLAAKNDQIKKIKFFICLLYTSPSPRDGLLSRMPSSA